MIKYKEYGLCMTGMLKNDNCKIDMASICEIATPAFYKNYTDLKSLLADIVRESEKRIKIYAHNLNYTGKYIISELTAFGLTDTTGKEDTEKSFNYIYNAVTGFFRFHIVYGKKSIDIIDSKKMAPITITDIADMLGITDNDYTALNLKCVSAIVQLLNEEGMKKGTIGGSCLEYFKEKTKAAGRYYGQLFPDLTKIKSANDHFKNVDEYIRASYHGGLCYVNPVYQNKIINNGTTIDRNAMYSSEMHSKSGNKYPYGLPMYTDNKSKIEKLLKIDNYYCFIYLSCNALKLKENRMPSIRPIEQGFMFTNKNEFVTEINASKANREYINGKLIKPYFVMTEKDFLRFIDDYEIEKLNIIDCYYFNTVSGIFDEYVDYFQNKKQNARSKGERQIAKLGLNNLTGKFGARPEVKGYSFNNGIKETEYTSTQKTLHVGIGSAITSYARQNLISTIYNIGFDKFCYCDTDSVHFIGHDTKDVFIDNKELGAWKIEREWTEARFIKQKIYIEGDKGNYDVTWAGLNKDGIKDIANDLNDGSRLIEDLGAKPIIDKIRVATPDGYYFESVQFNIK